MGKREVAGELPSSAAAAVAPSLAICPFDPCPVAAAAAAPPPRSPPATRLQGKYASLGFARTPTEWRNLAIFIGTISALLGGNWAVKAIGTSRTDSRRKAAVASLERDS